jgi:hypothetical protein
MARVYACDLVQTRLLGVIILSIIPSSFGTCRYNFLLLRNIAENLHGHKSQFCDYPPIIFMFKSNCFRFIMNIFHFHTTSN